MRSILLTLLVVGLVGIADARPACAQSSVLGTINAPFDFIVGDRVMPAGRYEVCATTNDPTLLVVTSATDTANAVLVAAIWTHNPALRETGVRFAFKKVRGHMFLWQIVTPGGSGREIVVTKATAERTLAKLSLLGTDVAGHDVK